MSPRKILELDVYQAKRRRARAKVEVPQGESQVITLDRIRAIRHTAIETKTAATAPNHAELMEAIHTAGESEVDLNALKEKIAVGDYPLDPRSIARSILEELMPGQRFTTSSFKTPARQK